MTLSYLRRRAKKHNLLIHKWVSGNGDEYALINLLTGELIEPAPITLYQIKNALDDLDAQADLEKEPF